MDSEAAPVGRTAAKGSRTGPNTLTTRPSGRFRLSRTSAPREGANSDRTRTVPSWAMFSTTPSRLMPPLLRPLAMRAYYLTRAEFICTGTGAGARRSDPVSGAARGRSDDRAVPRLSAGVLARERHTGAPSEDRGDVPRRQPEPRPRDERFVGGEPPRDVAPRRTGGRSRRHAAELHGELGPRADVRREREAAPPPGGPELAVRSGRAELPRDGEDEGHRDLQSEQSDRRGHGRGAAQGGVGRGPRPRGLV